MPSLPIYSRLRYFQRKFSQLSSLTMGLVLLLLPLLHSEAGPENWDIPFLRYLLSASWILAFLAPFGPKKPWLLQVRKYAQVLALFGTLGFYLVLLASNQFRLDYYLFSLILLGVLFSGMVKTYYEPILGNLYGVLIILFALSAKDPLLSKAILIGFSLVVMVLLTLVNLIRVLWQYQLRFYLKLISSQMDLAMLIQEKGNVLYASVSDLSWSLWDPEKPSRVNFFDLLDKEYFTKIKEGIQELINGERQSFEAHLRIADFRLKWHLVDARIELLENRLGRPHIVISGDLVPENQDVSKALAQRSDELKQFVYRTAHDFQGPLATIAGLRILIEEEVKDEVAQLYFNMIFTSTQRLNESLERQLDLAEITKESTAKTEIDFEGLALQVIQEVKKSPGLGDSNIHVDLPRRIPFFSDPNMIRIILRNLIANAARYRDPNGIPNEVSVSLDTLGEQYIISVEDNGPGIQEKYQKKIFEMFFRGSNQSVGSGLGLYIVRNSVERLNGKVVLTKSDETGSVFSVLLPLFGN